MVAYSGPGERLAFTDEYRNLVLTNGDGTITHKVEQRRQGDCLPKLVVRWQVHRIRDRRIFQRPVVPGQLALIRPDGSGSDSNQGRTVITPDLLIAVSSEYVQLHLPGEWRLLPRSWDPQIWVLEFAPPLPWCQRLRLIPLSSLELQ
jgi:hypothetical protein